MTRLEARTLIRKQLGETTAAFWTDAELNTWINLAGHDIAEKTLCIQDKGFVTTLEDIATYDMDSIFAGFLAPVDVYFNQNGSDWVEIERRGIKEMNNEYPGWKNAESGTPFLYTFEPERGRILTLYVPPDATNAGTNYLEVYYGKDFVDLTKDTDDLSDQLPQSVLELALVDWVVATGFESRRDQDKANDRWAKFGSRLLGYHTNSLKHDNEDEDIIMKPYRR